MFEREKPCRFLCCFSQLKGSNLRRPRFLLKQYCLSFSYLKVSHPIFIFFKWLLAQTYLCPVQLANKLSIHCSPFRAGRGSLGGWSQVSNQPCCSCRVPESHSNPSFVSLVWNKASQRWPLRVLSTVGVGYVKVEDCFPAFTSRLFPPSYPSLWPLEWRWLRVPRECSAHFQAVSVFWKWNLDVTNHAA